MKILITGATGLIGKSLVKELIAHGHSIAVLSRSRQPIAGVQTFLWDIASQAIDSNCIQGVDVIVHLAGKGIADGAWTTSNQQKIIDSRVVSMQLIAQLLASQPHQVKKIVSASGVGFYGGDTGAQILYEDMPAGTDFLGKCCVLWENSVVQTAHQQRIPHVLLRTGLVLSEFGGALPLMAKPVQMYVGAPLGSGKQIVPWIHLHDVVQVYINAIETSLQGVFNLCAPNLVSNSTLTKQIAQTLKRPFWRLAVPSFLLKLILGEKSILVLGSTHASSEKLQKTGFQFKFRTIDTALNAIYPIKK